MATCSLYIRADEVATRNATVTTTVGATDSDYTDDWLCNGKPNVPARATNGTVTWSLAFSSASIDAVVVANHNIDGGATITLGGGLTATPTAPAARKNSIPYNALYYPGTTAAGVTGFTVGVAANSANVTIGEVMAGPVRSFPGRGLLLESPSGSNLRRGNGRQSLSVNPYDDATASRVWQSEVIGTASERDDMMAAFEAQRNASRPMVFIPDSSVNDAWLVEMGEPSWTVVGTFYRITLTFTEIPRVRW